MAGAALTNPLDVIQNEMFKTNLGLLDDVCLLDDVLGWTVLVRAMSKINSYIDSGGEHIFLHGCFGSMLANLRKVESSLMKS